MPTVCMNAICRSIISKANPQLEAAKHEIDKTIYDSEFELSTEIFHE